MWLSNVKCLWLSTNTSWALVFCIYTHVCIITNYIGTINENEIYLPNKESISGHRCERTNMAYKCKIFEAVNLTLHGH